jgi:hypothetical protein
VKGKERKPKIYGTVVESERVEGGILLGFGLAWVQGNLWEVGMEDDVVGVSSGVREREELSGLVVHDCRRLD